MDSMKIVKCTCQHSYQDELYGKGNRCANETRTGQFRCTVCQALHGSASLTTAVKAKPAAPTEPVAKKEPEKAKDAKAEKPAKKASLKGNKR